MSEKRRPASPISRSWLPVIIIAIGIVLTLWMRQFTHNSVFFNSQSGLKALVAQQLGEQIKAGSFPLDISLQPPKTLWISELWQTGLSPFTPPITFEVATQTSRQTFANVPFTFPLVSAPFYALLGKRGLYVVPLVSLWIIWLRFWQIGNRARWGTVPLCIGLSALVLASPLTLHSWIYGEYTLAVAIAFWAISSLIFPKNRYLSKPTLFWNGCLIALSVWLSPELIGIVIAISLLALCGWLKPNWRTFPNFTANKAIILIGAMVCTLGLLLAINYATYAQIFISNSPALTSFATTIKASYLTNLTTFQAYFPLVWVVALAALLSPELKQPTVKINPLKSSHLADQKGQFFDRIGIRKTLDSQIVPGRFALWLSILCLLVTLPIGTLIGSSGDAQWSPSAYLILIPLLSTVLAEQLRAGFFRPWSRQLLIIGAVVAILLGIHINVGYGIFTFYKNGPNTSLKANYEQTLPTITALRESPLTYVATADEAIAQTLLPALPNKTFFFVNTPEQARQLTAALLEQEVSEFLYLCSPNQTCAIPNAESEDLTLADNRHTITSTSIGEYGRYPAYQMTIAEVTNPPTDAPLPAPSAPSPNSATD